jgi:hypothetical protein
MQARTVTLVSPEKFAVNMKWLWGLFILLLLTAGGLHAQSSDDQFIQAYALIEEGDALNKAGKVPAAKAKYVEAQTTLLSLKKENPGWKTKVVAYRLNELTAKIAALSQPATPSGEASVSPSNPSAPATQEPKPVLKMATLPPDTKVRLLAAGKEPRQALRIKVQPGDTQTAETMMNFQMGMGPAGTPVQLAKTPPTKFTTSLTVKNVSADGDIDYELVVDDVEVMNQPGIDPQMLAAMKESLRGAKGLKIVCTMADRGFKKKAEAEIPPGTKPEARESMKQMEDTFSDVATMLPHEPVGIGAKWEVKEKNKSDGMTIDQTSVYELVSIEGTLLTIKSSITETAANQKIANPMVPNGKADLIKMTGAGTENTTIDLTKIMPSKGTAEVHTETTMSMDMGGQKQTIVIKSATDLQMETK